MKRDRARRSDPGQVGSRIPPKEGDDAHTLLQRQRQALVLGPLQDQVDAERFLGQRSGGADGGAELLGAQPGCGQHAQRAGVGDRGRERGTAGAPDRRLDDGDLDAEEVAEWGVHTRRIATIRGQQSGVGAEPLQAADLRGDLIADTSLRRWAR